MQAYVSFGSIKNILVDSDSTKEYLHNQDRKRRKPQSSKRQIPRTSVAKDIAQLHEERLRKYEAEGRLYSAECVEYLLESAKIINEYITVTNNPDGVGDSAKVTRALIHAYNEIVGVSDSGSVSEVASTDEDTICKQCDTYFEFVDGYLVCKSCGITKNLAHFSDVTTYRDMQDHTYKPQFAYDKRTHFGVWLSRFEDNDAKPIPPEIIDSIKYEAKKERITDLNKLTEGKVRKYLKKLNYNDQYTNVIPIINKINGREPIRLTTEIKDKLYIMFQQVDDVYPEFKPVKRKNFMSYSYLLHKFFLILGIPEYAAYFPLLKSIDKLQQQEELFKKITMYLSKKYPAENSESIDWSTRADI